MTHGSRTTVSRPLGGCTAPSMRVARSAASIAAADGVRSDGSRPTEKPNPVCVSSPSVAMAYVAKKQLVSLPVVRIPALEAMAASEIESAYSADSIPEMRGSAAITTRSSSIANAILSSVANETIASR